MKPPNKGQKGKRKLSFIERCLYSRSFILLNCCLKVDEDKYEEQVTVVADVLQETVLDQTQQNEAVLDVVADFFHAVANVTTAANISTQVMVMCNV